jgi:hypothetical protein
MRRKNGTPAFAAILLFLTTAAGTLSAQTTGKAKRTGAIYASWGYNTEWYTRSTVTVKQQALGNNYKMVNVRAHDNEGWDKDLLHQDFTIPQYNYRLGYYFNDKQDMAFEINFDHTKYIITDNQDVHVKGTIGDLKIDEHINFSSKNGFYYFLNNGANFLLFNIVKRQPIFTTRDRNLYVDLLGKAGIGPVIPHVENSFFGMANKKGFQLGGWNAGIETALRVTVMKYGYLEFAQKVDYARYSGLKVYQGRARQAFGTYELILSVGAMIPTTKNGLLFTRVGEEKAE